MNVYLVYLNWPESCFRANVSDMAFLRELVPHGSEVVRTMNDASFLHALPRATHVITWHFDPRWFALAHRLRVLATPGAGRELMPSEAPEGVTIHFGHFHGAIMAETVAAFVFAWARGLFRPERNMRWGRSAMGDKCYCVSGTRAVVYGYGNVGRAIGEKLRAVGVDVFGYSRSMKVDARTLDRKLRDADWFVMALPSDTGTDDLLDMEMISRLSHRCVVINVGRGNAVDEEALVEALRSHRIAGACLDVFKGEPGPLRKKASGRTPPVILKLGHRATPRNLVKLPHASAFSGDYIRRALLELKDDGLI